MYELKTVKNISKIEDNIFIYESFCEISADLIKSLEERIKKSFESIEINDVSMIVDLISMLKLNEQLYVIMYLLDLHTLNNEGVYKVILSDKKFEVHSKIINSILTIFNESLKVDDIDKNEIEYEKSCNFLEEIEKETGLKVYIEDN
jgi:hypothetical protein